VDSCAKLALTRPMENSSAGKSIAMNLNKNLVVPFFRNVNNIAFS